MLDGSLNARVGVRSRLPPKPNGESHATRRGCGQGCSMKRGFPSGALSALRSVVSV